MTPINKLRAEVNDILDQLSHDELRVFRFMGRRMIDIGHAKYGALDLEQHARVWSKEMAQETADRRFYAECEEIAREDRRAERLRCFALDEAFARMEPVLTELAQFDVSDAKPAELSDDERLFWEAL